MNNQSNKGFTLVELAVSLVVIGLLIGLGIGLVGPLVTAVKVRESKENLGGAVESVNSWAAGNNRLPDNSTGNQYSFVNVVKTPFDAWGRDFIYLYDSNFTTAPITKDTICGRRTTTVTLTDSNTSASIPNIAYIILSKGDDATLDTTASDGTVTTSRPVTGTVSANTTSDLVRWVTLDELRTKVGCQGAQMRIVNNELPYGYNNTSYSANIYADGGVPFASGGKYSWCIQTSLGDIPTPSTLTFKTTDGTDVPFKASCSNLNVKSDHLVIGGTPVTIVKGSDNNNYLSIQSHISVEASNKPITGANYSQYWQMASSGITAPAWITANYYPASSNNVTVYAYDSGGNYTYKAFVLTINP